MDLSAECQGLVALAHAVAANEKAQRKFRNAVLITLARIDAMLTEVQGAQPARLPFLGVAENDGRHKRVFQSGYCFVATGREAALFSYSSRLGNFTLALFA